MAAAAVDSVVTRLNNALKQTAATLVGGVAHAFKMPQLNATGQLDLTMMPSGIASNTTPATNGATALVAGNFVALSTVATVTQANKADNGSLTTQAAGFVLSAVAIAGAATVYLDSQNNALSGLTVGASYFLGTAGAAVTAGGLGTLASGTILQGLGIAVQPTAINFTYSEPATVQ